MTGSISATAQERSSTVVTLAVVGLVLGALLVVPLLGTAQDDQPGSPVNIYGDVNDEAGEPAPAGTTIVAVVDGTVEDILTVEEPGEFGGPDAFDERLVVNDGAGDAIEFRVGAINGPAATDTLDLENADPVEEVTLTFPAGAFEDPPVDDAPADDEPADDDPAGDPGAGAPTGPSPTTGDPGPPADVDVTDERIAALTIADETATATFEAGTVRSVAFDIPVSGSVTVRDLATAPDVEPPGDAVSTTQIVVPSAAESLSATLTKSVTPEQRGDRDPESLRILRLDDGTWEPLETTVVEDTADAVRIEAETPRFSVFAVSSIEAPTAAFDVTPAEPTVDEELTLDASASMPADVTYEWTIDGEVVDGETATVTPEEPGDLTVELTVENTAGETDTTTETLTVAPAADEPTDDAPADDAPDDAPEDDGIPGFGPVAAVVAVVTATVLARWGCEGS